MVQHYDVVIVGAGLAGLATAYYLTRHSSLKILLLEKESAPGLHASGKNAAMLRQVVLDASIASFIQETLKNLKNPPDDWSQKNLLRQCGSLLLGRQESIERLQLSLEKAGGLAELYSFGKFPSQLSPSLKSQLQHSDYEAMLYSPRDGIVDVEGLLRVLCGAAVQKGLVLRYGEEVQKLYFEENVWNILSLKNRYRAKLFINAAGAWAPQLASFAGGLGEEMQAFRRHLYLSTTCEMPVASWPLVWNIDEEFYFRSQESRLLLSAGDEEAYSSFEPQVDEKILERLYEKSARLFPALPKLSIEKAWACLRTKTRLGSFFIDWDRRVENFFWVSALGGHGVGASLGVGRLAAEKILERLGA